MFTVYDPFFIEITLKNKDKVFPSIGIPESTFILIPIQI